ncbi:YitT family protein [Sporolactobacillus sp. THM19-2]|uniref:YczE/YyaS/YitT family protein n=1 Tax=Sporolactobacillus sp. THM19-2 TaxID=2511171 RepID=UPI001F0DC11B|nr:hypothetical protein [Sporolactobacillus sp. THM19-2]
MQTHQSQTGPLKMNQSLTYFSISIFFNALGNALTVALNLGSALWTASSVNITQWTGIHLDIILFLTGAAVVVVNTLIVGKIDWHRIIGNIIFMFPFSFLVDAFSYVLVNLGIMHLPLLLRIVLDLAGICLIAAGISIYQRVNLVLHPCDDLMQIIRFKYFKGSAAIAQLVTFMPPVLIILLSWAITGKIYAINIGTVFALLFQGALVGLFDRTIFPSLKHQHLSTDPSHIRN